VHELTQTWWVLPLFFLVAMLYASVGHGGASGYLALFSLLGVANAAVVPIALVLNILVAGVGFFVYRRSGYFSFRTLLPFVLGSIPSAYLGGSVHLSSEAFAIVLGLALVFAALRLLFLGKLKADQGLMTQPQTWWLSLIIGVALGFVSGMVGIGGGIFLSPILLFLKWTSVKQTASLSSGFIVVNSISGLAGHLSHSSIPDASIALSGLFVLAGGFAGSALGANHISPRFLQILLGFVLLIAGSKLLVPFIA
jgi:uncharacterized membrane protein YfcA